jgi:hypothetical protein
MERRWHQAAADGRTGQEVTAKWETQQEGSWAPPTGGTNYEPS